MEESHQTDPDHMLRRAGRCVRSAPSRLRHSPGLADPVCIIEQQEPQRKLPTSLFIGCRAMDGVHDNATMLAQCKCDKILVLHSIEDELIPFAEGLQLKHLASTVCDKTVLLPVEGSHSKVKLDASTRTLMKNFLFKK